MTSKLLLLVVPCQALFCFLVSFALRAAKYCCISLSSSAVSLVPPDSVCCARVAIGQPSSSLGCSTQRLVISLASPAGAAASPTCGFCITMNNAVYFARSRLGVASREL